MVTWLQKLKHFFERTSLPVDPLQSFRDFGKQSRQWWGTFEVEAEQSKFWRIGNIVILVDRFSNEWHIANYPVTQTNDLSEDDSENSDSSQFGIASEQLNFKTYTFRTQAEITLTPILADRPLASKLERPLCVPGGEKILLYVSSPVWVRVQTGASKIILDEIPTFYLSDTWFGSSTLEGELCYAGHTYCSPHLKDLPIGPDRIISPMLIKNQSKALLLIEKLRVPLPYLSVYSDPQNYLWTDQLNIIREGDDIHPEVQVAKGPPKSVENLIRINFPRKESTHAVGLKRFFPSFINK